MTAVQRDALRLTLSLAALGGLVFAGYRETVLGPLLGGLTVLTTDAVFATLRALGVEVARQGTVLFQPGGFAYEIYFRCTGFLPVVCLAVAILASPGSRRRKLLGLAYGIPLLLVLNLFRLVHLFQVGVQRPEIFPFVHGVLWEGGIVVAVMALWLLSMEALPRLGRRRA